MFGAMLALETAPSARTLAYGLEELTHCPSLGFEPEDLPPAPLTYFCSGSWLKLTEVSTFLLWMHTK